MILSRRLQFCLVSPDEWSAWELPIAFAFEDADWTAPRVGQNWRDDELMLAVAWLKSFVPYRDMDRRINAAKTCLAASREQMRDGVPALLFETFATDRVYWSPEGVMRAVPFLTRIGKELPLLLSIKGVEERAVA